MNDLHLETDVIVFASGEASPDCVTEMIGRGEGDQKAVYHAGTKHFGDNLNRLTQFLSRNGDSWPTRFRHPPWPRKRR